jgi:hypothetical protein
VKNLFSPPRFGEGLGEGFFCRKRLTETFVGHVKNNSPGGTPNFFGTFEEIRQHQAIAQTNAPSEKLALIAFQRGVVRIGIGHCLVDKWVRFPWIAIVCKMRDESSESVPQRIAKFHGLRDVDQFDS